MTKALYPGSFDPITNGHIDIASRAAAVFDELVLGVYATPAKNLMFTTDERVEMAKEALAHLPNVTVTTYTGLTVHAAQKMGAAVLVRGLRAITDFQAEFELGLMNRLLTPNVETVCLMTERRYSFVSSSLLKEACALGGDISELVPRHVHEALQEKLRLRVK